MSDRNSGGGSGCFKWLIGTLIALIGVSGALVTAHRYVCYEMDQPPRVLAELVCPDYSPISFTVQPNSARRGTEVQLHMNPPMTNVSVYYNGVPLPKKTLHEGRVLVVTIPSTAVSGYFEIEVDGQRIRADEPFTVE